MRSSLDQFAGARGEPDPQKARKEADAAWHPRRLILMRNFGDGYDGGT
jgi:hypothetical protein